MRLLPTFSCLHHPLPSSRSPLISILSIFSQEDKDSAVYKVVKKRLFAKSDSEEAGVGAESVLLGDTLISVNAGIRVYVRACTRLE